MEKYTGKQRQQNGERVKNELHVNFLRSTIHLLRVGGATPPPPRRGRSGNKKRANSVDRLRNRLQSVELARHFLASDNILLSTTLDFTQSFALRQQYPGYGTVSDVSETDSATPINELGGACAVPSPPTQPLVQPVQVS